MPKPASASTARTRTSEVAAAAARAHPDGSDASPHAWLTHMLVHDTRHRGQILLALKPAGHASPDDEAPWGSWRR